MPHKEWGIMLDNHSYKIEVTHGAILRKYTIILNGEAIKPSEVVLIKGGNRLSFNINNHLCHIIITYSDGFDYDLVVDNISYKLKETIALPEKWDPPKRGCLSEIFQTIIFLLITTLIVFIGGSYTGSVIDFAIITILVFIIIKRLYKGYKN